MKRKILLTLSVLFLMGQTCLIRKELLLKEIKDMIQEIGEYQFLY
jgi:hypothetical protein